jgi:hypothetical protein
VPEPRVLCVMLANGREAMVRRAVRCFQHQIYANKRLLIYASGLTEPEYINEGGIYTEWTGDTAEDSVSIGSLRNQANGYARPEYLDCEIIAHFDSDDWSAPRRLIEQVDLLYSSGAIITGYRDMLFWNKCASGDAVGETWFYSAANPLYCLGTSLCYWRAVWERQPFKPLATGEDTEWLLHFRAQQIVAVSSMPDTRSTPIKSRGDPRMVASIHGGNACSAIKPGAREWRRAAEWDSLLRERMEL